MTVSPMSSPIPGRFDDEQKSADNAPPAAASNQQGASPGAQPAKQGPQSAVGGLEVYNQKAPNPFHWNWNTGLHKEAGAYAWVEWDDGTGNVVRRLVTETNSQGNYVIHGSDKSRKQIQAIVENTLKSLSKRLTPEGQRLNDPTQTVLNSVNRITLNSTKGSYSLTDRDTDEVTTYKINAYFFGTEHNLFKASAVLDGLKRLREIKSSENRVPEEKEQKEIWESINKALGGDEYRKAQAERRIAAEQKEASDRAAAAQAEQKKDDDRRAHYQNLFGDEPAAAAAASAVAAPQARQKGPYHTPMPFGDDSIEKLFNPPASQFNSLFGLDEQKQNGPPPEIFPPVGPPSIWPSD